MEYNFDQPVNRENSNCLKFDDRQRFFGSTDLIPMWVADMDFQTPPFIIDAIKKRAGHPVYGYSFRPEEYYSSISSWYKRRQGWMIRESEICFSPGVVPALNMLIQTFSSENDRILIQPPVYNPFFSAIENNKRQLVINQLILENGRYRMDLDDLEEKFETGVKMLLFSSPHNPVSRAWTEDELIDFAKLCKKYNVLIVSDEIHGDLVLPGHKHNPLSVVFEEYKDNIISCIAPSKTFNLAGLATSSVIIPDEKKREQFMNILDRMKLGMGNLFGITASIAAYNNGDEWLDQLLEYVKGNVDYVDYFIKTRIPHLKLIAPEATYLLWIDFRGLGLGNDELKDFLIYNAKLGFNDGRIYRDGGEGFFRMNVACPRETVETAMKRLESSINSLNL